MAGDLSPQMRQRYGLDRNPWPLRIFSAAVVAAFLAALVALAVKLTAAPITPRILLWQQPQPDRVDITFDVSKPAGMAVSCVLRAQDADRTDLGYATVDLQPAPRYQQTEYSLRVLGRAVYIEILACGPTGERLRVPPPNFPPGVVPPAQPWTAVP